MRSSICARAFGSAALGGARHVVRLARERARADAVLDARGQVRRRRRLEDDGQLGGARRHAEAHLVEGLGGHVAHHKVDVRLADGEVVEDGQPVLLADEERALARHLVARVARRGVEDALERPRAHRLAVEPPVAHLVVDRARERQAVRPVRLGHRGAQQHEDARRARREHERHRLHVPRRHREGARRAVRLLRRLGRPRARGQHAQLKLLGREELQRRALRVAQRVDGRGRLVLARARRARQLAVRALVRLLGGGAVVEVGARHEVDLLRVGAAGVQHAQPLARDAARDERLDARDGALRREVLHHELHVRHRVEPEVRREVGVGDAVARRRGEAVHVADHLGVLVEDGGDELDHAPVGGARRLVEVRDGPRRACPSADALVAASRAPLNATSFSSSTLATRPKAALAARSRAVRRSSARRAARGAPPRAAWAGTARARAPPAPRRSSRGARARRRGRRAPRRRPRRGRARGARRGRRRRRPPRAGGTWRGARAAPRPRRAARAPSRRGPRGRAAGSRAARRRGRRAVRGCARAAARRT